MGRWRKLGAACVMAVGALAARAASVDLGPASQDAILAGAKACIGTTADPGGVAARLAGWSPAPAGAFKTDGQALTRGHVLLAVTPGVRGACIVSARAGQGFSGKRLLTDLQQLFGARLRSVTPPVVVLPNGEMMRINTGSRGGGPVYVQLALAAAKGN